MESVTTEVQEAITMDTCLLEIHDLPWHDVIFTYILPKLDLADLFRLRATSKMLHKCVCEYYAVMKHLSLAYIGPKFKEENLRSIIVDSYMLQTVDLSAAKQWLDNKLLLDIIKQNEFIEHINLHGCNSLGQGVLHGLGVYCKGLRQVVLGRCTWVTSAEVVQMAQSCQNLQHIDLSGCWNINDSAIIKITQFCKQCRHMNISDIYSITDVAICAVAYNCRDLRVLKLAACWRVTDEGIKTLSEYCKHLHVLQVKDCRSITDTSLTRLRVRGVLIDIPMRGFYQNANFNNAFHQAQNRLDSMYGSLKLQI